MLHPAEGSCTSRSPSPRPRRELSPRRYSRVPAAMHGCHVRRRSISPGGWLNAPGYRALSPPCLPYRRPFSPEALRLPDPYRGSTLLLLCDHIAWSLVCWCGGMQWPCIAVMLGKQLPLTSALASAPRLLLASAKTMCISAAPPGLVRRQAMLSCFVLQGCHHCGTSTWTPGTCTTQPCCTGSTPWITPHTSLPPGGNPPALYPWLAAGPPCSSRAAMLPLHLIEARLPPSAGSSRGHPQYPKSGTAPGHSQPVSSRDASDQLQSWLMPSLWSKRAADVVLMQKCCIPMQRMSGKLPCRCHSRPEMRHISISQVQVSCTSLPRACGQLLAFKAFRMAGDLTFCHAMQGLRRCLTSCPPHTRQCSCTL